MRQLGVTYRRMLTGSKMLSWLPYGLARAVNRAWERMVRPNDSFEAPWAQAVACGMPHIDVKAAQAYRRKLVADSFLHVFWHRRMTSSWLQRYVRLDESMLARLRGEQGALLLTWHSPLHHTMFAVLGLLELRLRVLAAPEETSPIFEEIGPYIRTLHRNCAGHFNGGDYAFFQSPRQAVRSTDQAIECGEVVVSLHDFRAPGSPLAGRALFDRPYPIPIGIIKWAALRSVPVYFASLLPEDGRYRLVIERAPESGWEGLVDYYLDRLEHNCRIAPAMWDNWPAWNQAPSNS